MTAPHDLRVCYSFQIVTASPASSTIAEMSTDIYRLCELMKAKIRMPIAYQSELEQIVNRPQMEFYEIDTNESMVNFKNCNYLSLF